MTSRTARGATYSWQASTGDWSVGTNWGGATPNSSATVYIANGGTANITLPGAVGNILYLGDTKSGNSGTIQMSDGSLPIGSAEYVGNSGAGAFIQSGGTNALSNGKLCLANSAASVGSYTLSGLSALTAGTESIGHFGSGTFTQSGGTNTSGYLYLGYSSSGSGSYNLSGSATLSGLEYIGYSGIGSFTQSGATNSVFYLYIANNVGSAGSYSLDTGGRLSATVMYVGQSGSGAFSQSDGTVTTADLYIGNNASSAGTCGVADNAQFTARNEYIGQSGAGSFTLAGGTNAVSGSISLGNSAGANGSYRLASGVLSAGTETIGYSGSGAFTQIGGSNRVDLPSNTGNCYLCLGYNSSGNGSYTLSGSASLSVGSDEYIGYSGTGAFVQSGGTNNTGYLYIGRNAGSTGTYSLGASGALSASQLYVGLSGKGVFSLTDNSLATTMLYVGDNLGSAGTCSLAGNAQLVAPLEYIGQSGTGSFVLAGGTNTVSQTLYLGNYAGSRGSYLVASGARLSANSIYVGNSGTGIFSQSGGLVSTNNLEIESATSSSGTGSYDLSGNAMLVVSGNETIGSSYNLSNSGSFTQTGGTHSVAGAFQVSGRGVYTLSGNGMLTAPNEGVCSFFQAGGTNSVVSGLTIDGTYSLTGNSLLSSGSVGVALGVLSQSGGTIDIGGNLNVDARAACYLSGSGLLSAQAEFVGDWTGRGIFAQSGGTNNVATSLTLGNSTSGTTASTYSLTGSGVLSAPNEYIGYNLWPSVSAGTCLFAQSGGINTTSQLAIGSSSAYVLAGGTLQVALNLASSGLFAGGAAPATLIGSGILDLSGGSLQNARNISVSVGANSLLIVPSGFNASTGFASYTNLGLLHTSGTTLNVAAGQGFGGWGSIRDPVVCQGTIAASPRGSINLLGGLQLSGTGAINLGSGTLQSADAISGITSGSLVAQNQNVGAGVFTQSGGSSTISQLSIASSGSYVLAGGVLQVNSGLYNQGTFSGGVGPAQLIANSVLDLSAGTLANLNTISLSMGSTSLLVLPPGLNPSTAFASYNGLGLSYIRGTTLNVPAGSEFIGSITISDPVVCQGTIMASPGVPIYLRNGLAISGTGCVNLGSGGGLINDPDSRMNGGSLSGSILSIGGGGAFSQSGGTSSLSTLSLAGSTGDVPTYNLSGNALLVVPSGENIGIGGVGAFNQTGGTNSCGYILFLGYFSGGSGTYNLSGNGLLQSYLEYVGNGVGSGSTGTFSQSGGTNIANGISVGGYGAVGLYTLSGGFLSGSVGIGGGSSGWGTMIQSGGTINGGGLGMTGGGSSYTLSGTGLLSAGKEEIYGGSFTQSSGTNNVSGELLLGSSVSYSLHGSGQISASTETVNGNFVQSGGTNVITSTLSLYGTYSMSGNSLLSSQIEYLGSANSGLLMQSGGSHCIGNALYLGSGSYSLSGSGHVYAAAEYIEQGSFSESGGTNSASALTVGGWGNGTYYLGGNALLSSSNETLMFSGTLAQTGGTNSVAMLTIDGNYYLDGNSLLSASTEFTENGQLTQTGGTNVVSSALNLGGNAYNLIGGLLIVPSLNGIYGIYGGSFNLNGGTLQASNSFSTHACVALDASGTATIDTAGFTVTLAGPVSSGGFVKTGSGTLILAYTDSYTGPTTVSEGSLIVNGSVVSPITVNSGGVLGGTGRAANVIVRAGGHLAPGDSPGTLYLAGPLTLASGAVLDYALGLPGNSDELLMPTGTLILNGQQFSDFNFTALTGFGPGKYTLIAAGSIDGTLGSDVSGSIDGLPASLAVQGDDVVVTVTVPEPSTFALLLAAVAALIAKWRRPPK